MSSLKLLAEDQIAMYNKWVRGIATREQKPSHVTVADLLQASGRNDQNKAPLELPYPMTHIVEDMGALFLAADNIEAKARKTKDNPVVTESEDASKGLDEFIDKCEKIKGILNSMTEDLDVVLQIKPFESGNTEA
tara:strand:+ start:220 stop:624 length:405 start_codon:yes stop_codon:yes gene_type:complete